MKKLYTCLFISLLAAGTISADAAPKRIKTNAGLSAPVVLPATDVTSEGFTANWKTYPGAETYTLLVYEPVDIAADGDYIILDETFNLVSQGTTVEPYFPEDSYVNLSDFDWTYTPDWSGYPVFARGMVSGILYSPYIALDNNDGKFTVKLSVTGEMGATVKLTSYGSTVDERTLVLTDLGSTEFTVEFTNGVHDTYLKFVDYGIMDDPDDLYTDRYDFLDDIQVIQTLKAGDTALRIVDTAEPETNSHTFETLPYRYGATRLAYDLCANIVTITDPDDPWGYDVDWSPYSALQYVTLGSNGVDSAELDNADAVTVYYTLQGVCLGTDVPAAGVYIARTADTARTVIIK